MDTESGRYQMTGTVSLEKDAIEGKISPEFQFRLSSTDSGQRIRVIVMIQVDSQKNSIPPTLSKEVRRQMTVQRIRMDASNKLKELNLIITEHGGTLLSPAPDALGCILVDTTVQGIMALARSPYVKIILEDQPIRLIR